MTQYNFDIAGDDSGDDLVAALDSFRDSLWSNHSGSSRPSYVVAGMTWLDTTADPAIWKYYDGAADIVIGYLHAASDLFMLADAALIANASDTTKRLRWDLSGLTTAQTRVRTPADRNLDEGKLVSGEYAMSLSDAERAQARRNIGAGAPDVILEDQKTNGTAGGGFTSGSQTRVLNIEVRDVGSNCALSSNQFVLSAGDWYIKWSAPAYAVNRHKTRLYNVTQTTVAGLGSSAYAGSASPQQMTRSEGAAVITSNGTDAYEIRHYAESTKTTNGFGVEATAGESEIFTIVHAWRLS